MKKTGWVCLAVILALLGLNLFSKPVQSARGTPDSPDFGYGMVIDSDGSAIPDSIQTAGSISVDWLAVTLDWAKQWPDEARQPDFAVLDQAMGLASRYNLAVMLKLSQAPAWASSPTGPSPERTAWFVINLARRYTTTLQAVELYPGANTVTGWGSIPDPVAYTNLFNYTRAAVKEAKLSGPLALVAGGLIPLPSPVPSSSDQDDLIFLNTLYQHGASQTMPIISLSLPIITKTPLSPPTPEEHRVLRHYEEIRQVMLANNHSQGILWVTGFHWPSNKIYPEDATYRDNLVKQNQWLIEAYRQLRSQLYVGVAFYETLNPPGNAMAAQIGNDNLIAQGATDHPFINSLMEIISQNNRQQSLPIIFNHPQSKHIFKDRLNPP
jgi:hypothetical protein